MQRQITLHGALADKYGSEPINLDVDSTSLLMSGLSCALPDFRQTLSQHSHFHLYKVDRNNNKLTAITPASWGMKLGRETELHLVPAVEGAGFEIAGMILGKAAVGTLAHFALGAVISIGVSLAVSAIASKLASTPSTTSSTNKAEDKPSFIYSNAVNVTTPGSPVPIVYGKFLVGSVVISGSVSTEQI